MGSLRPGSNLAFKSPLAPGFPNARDGPPPQPQCSCLCSLLPPALETPPQRREEPISEHALDSAPAPLDASPSLLPLAARPSGRKAGRGSTGGHFCPLCCLHSSFPVAGGGGCTGGGAVPAEGAAQAERRPRSVEPKAAARQPTWRRRRRARRWSAGRCSTWGRATPTSRTSERAPTAWFGECLRWCASPASPAHLMPLPVALGAAAALPAPWPRVLRRPGPLTSLWPTLTKPIEG